MKHIKVEELGLAVFKDGFTYPILEDGTIDNDEGVKVHVDDLILEREEKALVKVAFEAVNTYSLEEFTEVIMGAVEVLEEATDINNKDITDEQWNKISTKFEEVRVTVLENKVAFIKEFDEELFNYIIDDPVEAIIEFGEKENAKKSKAKEMFEKLGFKRRITKKSLIYIWEDSATQEVIKFDLKLEMFEWYEDGVWAFDPSSKEKLQAVIQQSIELGWFDIEKICSCKSS